MFGHYLELGLRSLRRHPALTALMVLLIALGVALSSVTFAALRAVSGDPLPDKSAQIFVPQLDDRPPSQRPPDGEPPLTLTYIDARALLDARRAFRQTVTYALVLAAMPADPSRPPFTVQGYAVTADFFDMFEVPFDVGRSWGDAEDARGAPEVVISRRLNARMFGDAGGAGHILRLGEQSYRVVGVVGDWNPQPHFYAGENINAVTYRGDAPDIYLPFRSAIHAQVAGMGGYQCLPDEAAGDWAARLRSECNWINVWVELRTPAEASAYRDYLDGYAAEQQRSGRWPWAPNVRLRNLTQWLDYVHAVPYEASIAFALAVGLQLVCLINVIGLLLAKFMRRGLEIGVRRALGASGGAIARQFLVEGAIVGLAGAALGVLLTLLAVWAAGAVFQPKIARLIHVDATLFGVVLLSSLLTALLAAAYPTWRASRVQPAWQLKAN